MIKIKHYIIIAHTTFLILFALAVSFALDRTINGHSPLLFLNFIDNFNGNIPLKTLSLLFSIFPFICFYSIFLIIAYVFKNKPIALVVPLFATYGMLTFLNAYNSLLWGLVLATLLLAVVKFFCPKTNITNNAMIISIVLLFVSTFLAANYPASPEAVASKIFYVNGLSFFIENIKSFLLIFVILCFYLILYFIGNKKIKQLIFFIGGLIIITGINFFARKFRIEMEASFLPFAFICIVPFCTEIIAENHNKKRIIVFTIVLLVCNFFNIAKGINFSHKNNNYLSKIYTAVKSSGDKKLALNATGFRVENLDDRRFLGAKSLLFTTLTYNDSRTFSVFYPTDSLLIDSYKNADIINIAENKQICSDNLSQKYFTSLNTPYTIINKGPVVPKRVFQANCNAEYSRRINGLMFFAHDDNDMTLFGNADSKTDIDKFSGNYSVLLNNQYPFGCNINIPVKSFDLVKIKVFRKGGPNGHIVITSTHGARNFYITEENIIERYENGWELINLETYIPTNVKNIMIYLWNANPKSKDIYFDDLTVEIFRE